MMISTFHAVSDRLLNSEQVTYHNVFAGMIEAGKHYNLQLLVKPLY